MIIIAVVTISGGAVWTELQLIFLGEVKRAISIPGMFPRDEVSMRKESISGVYGNPQSFRQSPKIPITAELSPNFNTDLI
jgi:hypothetical protein